MSETELKESIAPATGPEKKSKKKGRIQSSKNWRSEQIVILLHWVDRHLPIGQNEWKLVAEDYNKDRRHPEPDNADMDRVKSKFVSLYLAKKPTGNHEKGKMITTAQEIQSKIEKKVYGAQEAPSMNRSQSFPILSSASDNPDDDDIDSDEKEDDIIRAGVRGSVGLTEEPNSASSASSSSSRSSPSPSSSHSSASSSSASSSSSSSNSKKRKTSELKEATDSINGNFSKMMDKQLGIIKEERVLRAQELDKQLGIIKEERVLRAQEMSAERVLRAQEMSQEREIRAQEMKAVTDAFKDSFLAAIELMMKKKEDR